VSLLDKVNSQKPAYTFFLTPSTLLYLPQYSPDLDPIELAFAKFKALLRKAAERSVRSLWRRIGSLIPKLTPQECANYFRHAGYAAT
jgi:transposase